MSELPHGLGFSDEDFEKLLNAPSQASLGRLYRSIRGVATDFDRKSGNLTGDHQGKRDDDQMSVEWTFYPQPMLRGDLRQGATAFVRDIGRGGKPVEFYDLLWKNDPEGETGVYFELWKTSPEGGETFCGQDTVTELLGWMEPVAEPKPGSLGILALEDFLDPDAV